jgi:hypothetical protein
VRCKHCGVKVEWLPVMGKVLLCIRNDAREAVPHLPQCKGYKDRVKKLIKRVIKQKLRFRKYG